MRPSPISIPPLTTTPPDGFAVSVVGRKVKPGNMAARTATWSLGCFLRVVRKVFIIDGRGENSLANANVGSGRNQKMRNAKSEKRKNSK